MIIKVVDYAKDFDKVLWQKFQDYVVTTTDNLKYNYIGLNPLDFVSFPVVIINNTIVCFSALQVSKDKWGDKIGRVSTRMWLHPDYRHKGRFVGGTKFLNTTYCLPMQLAKAKLIGLDCVFISRESNFKGFEEYLKLIKINCKIDFIMETNRYNVCGLLDPVPESCKQWVMVHCLTPSANSVWINNMSKYILY